VQPQDLEQLIWPLACRKINGIGPKADARLQALGITTIGDLAPARSFSGPALWQILWGLAACRRPWPG
jgi:nucleotidyltransferase/DNA polymerase involved in DNA repair